jgi:uncharacterized protein YprB with RNaseH-like and TPR domain
MTEEIRNCRFCNKEFTTKDHRKVFCDKRCADRNRNRAYEPLFLPSKTSITDLKDFRKLDEQGKSDVLLGKAGFSIASYDIEATHLKPDVGRILCCSFKPYGQEPYTFSGLERRFKRADVYDDGDLAKAIIQELERYDVIIGWNSKAFDYKFVNSRAIRTGGRVKKAQHHIDAMWSWRTKVSARARLDSVQRFLIHDTEQRKTSIRWDKWMQALGWDPKLSKAAMDEIVEHCEIDVNVLEDVYTLMVEAGMVRSIRKDGGIL